MFIHYIVRTPMFATEAERWSYGITSDQWSLRPEHFKMIRFPVPPAEEQAAIVKYLAHANARIDKAIATKRRLIALLGEEAVVRSDYVTRVHNILGTGVDYVRLKTILSEVDERSVAGLETHLSMSQAKGLVRAEQVDRTLTADSMANGKLCAVGDIVLNRLKAHLGVFAVAPENGVVSADYTVLRAKEGVSAEYVSGALRSESLRAELRRRVKGIVEGFWRLYTDDLLAMHLPLPCLAKQIEIIDAVSVEMATRRAASHKVRREIDLLEEFRTRLVADVVTGQVDVRKIAASLPDIDPEATPDDLVNDADPVEIDEALEVASA